MQGYQFYDTDRSLKLLILFIVMILLVLFFLLGIDSILNSKRRLPKKVSTIHDRALRGSIVSKDGFTVAKSTKRYKAKIYPLSISPEKEELFIKLFSIYSKIPQKQIKDKIYKSDGTKRQGYVTLSKNIDVTTSIYLKSLARKFRRLSVFKPILNSRGESILYGLDVLEEGEIREYPFGDTLTPIIGYVRQKVIKNRAVKVYQSLNQSRDWNSSIIKSAIDCIRGEVVGQKNNIVEIKKDVKTLYGVKGLEQKYNKYLFGRVDGIIQGKRDIARNIIVSSKTSKIGERIDGFNLHLNIDMNLQKRVEMTIDKIQKRVRAKEIIAAVMESKSGKILAIATDKRYSPSHITKDDIPKLQPKFTEYLYEPGSVLKPITLAIAFELGIVNPNTLINTHNGILPLTRRYRIRDDEPFKNLTATDIIVHSSNIGITEIVWRMSAKDFHDGLKRFNLGEPSGIDLPRDLRGRVKSEKLLRNRVDKANQSYGYGMQLTFMQLLRAYSTFNNGGVEVTPSIVDYFENLQGEKFYLKNSRQKRRVISESSALKIKKILKAVVERGTGKAGQYEGLELGGKTGTAHIYDFGAKRYVERYNSSFFGFANDGKGGAYTIGVLAIEPTTENKYYFASKSAVPTFHDIVDDLVKLDYLKPNLSIHRQKELKKEQKRNQELLKIRHQERTKKVKELLRRQRELAKRKKNRLKRKKRVRINRVKKRKNKTSTRTIYQKTRPKRPKPIKRVYPKHTQKPKRPKPIPKPAPKPTQIIKPKPIKKPIPVRVPQDVDLF